MKTRLTRRSALRVLAGSAAAGSLFVGRRASAAPAAEIRDLAIISKQPDKYHGWPTVARRKNGQLLVSCSGGREAHVCPFGRVELISSDDGGATWSEARVLMDTPIDDRDSGVLETVKGSILVTTFTSLAYVPILERARKIAAGEKGAWPAEKMDRWLAVHNQLDEAQRKAQLGVWMLRSTDAGKTFGEPYRSLVNGFPSRTDQLADGRVLYAGEEPHQEDVPWVESARIDRRRPELAAIGRNPAARRRQRGKLPRTARRRATDGRIVAQIEEIIIALVGETTHESESDDGGRRVDRASLNRRLGTPLALVRLADGRLLMTYGHRPGALRQPGGSLGDGGRTWSNRW